MLTLNKHSKNLNEKNIYLKIVQQNRRGCVGPRGEPVSIGHVESATWQVRRIMLSSVGEFV